jgi:hypothetical protein
MHDDDRAAWEAAELAGIARQAGGKREYDEKLGIMVWRIPAWLCPHCTPIGGPETPPLEGCPCPLARHGPINQG